MYKRWTLGRIIRRLLLVALLLVVVLNWTWGRIPKEPPVPQGKFAEVGDLRIHYVEQPGAGRPVVLVHGLPGSWNDWNAVTGQLKGRHTISIDRPGFGYSDGDYVPFGDQVTAINGLVRKLKLKDPVIAGHSYGGALALSYANKYPRETHAIVLVDPAVADDISTFEVAQAQLVKVLQAPVIKPIADATFSQAMRTASADSGDKVAFEPDPVNPEHKKHLLELNMQSEDLKAYSGEMTHFQDLFASDYANWQKVTTPAYFVQGRDDQLVPTNEVRQFYKQMPAGHWLELPGGHMQNYVHPAEVAAQIKLAAR